MIVEFKRTFKRTLSIPIPSFPIFYLWENGFCSGIRIDIYTNGIKWELKNQPHIQNQLLFTRVTKEFNRERIVFSINGVGITDKLHVRNIPEPFLLLYKKINSKRIRDLNVRAKTVNPLRENIGVNLCDLGLSKVFLVVTQKQVIKDKLKFIKNGNFGILNDINKKVKRQLNRMEKLFAYPANIGKVLYVQFL